MSSHYVGKSGYRRRNKRPGQHQGQLLEQVTETVQTVPRSSVSPRWSATTKLLVGLVIVGVIAFLLIRFTSLITPLLMVFILAYLLHPVAKLLSESLHISWKTAVNILYFVILVLIIGSLTLGGVGLAGQVRIVFGQIQDLIKALPEWLQALSGEVFQIGPFTLDMRNIDVKAVSQQVLAYIQPLLSRTGTVAASVAGGAAEMFGWTFFVLIVSYFLMVESSGLQSDLFKVEVPGYNEDLRKLGHRLSIIWNSFLRGQIIIFSMATVVYIVVLSILGVQYAIGIAVLAGLAKFLPYIGPAITWIIMALVTYFQPDKPFGLDGNALAYMLLVVISTTIIDWIIDNLIAPRIMARTLRVHPAAVLITALVAANLLGILGVLIAAPLLASLMLLGRYIMRKMFDLDPWPRGDPGAAAHSNAFEWIARTRVFIVSRFQKMMPQETKAPKENSDEQQSQ